MEAGNTENKENISRKRSLSESNSIAGIEANNEGRPVTKKVKVVDIILGTNETTDVTDVKVEPFIDGMYRFCVCVCECTHAHMPMHVH